MCVCVCGTQGERVKTFAKTMMLKESDQNKVHKMGNSINLSTKQPTSASAIISSGSTSSIMSLNVTNLS